jgi:hypothetical protein
MAAGLEPAQEFRFYNVERAKPGGARLRIRDSRESGVRRRCESIDRCFATGIGGAESVSIGALRGKPVGIHTESFGIYDTAFFREFGIKSHRPVREPANSQRKHSPVHSQRQHTSIQPERRLAPIVGGRRRRCQPLWIELQPAQFIWRERIQW